MTPERHRQIGELVHAAVALNPEHRPAFLAEACTGDEALRREVESLLANESRAAGFLSTAALADGLMRPPVLVGRQLGPYTIQAPLGAGGMGEVYRARDRTLGRDVAIKILPRVFTTDRERRARFDREARLLASLNHPHIGAIYGLEDMEGTPALILELVDGDTLAERIANGPIPISEALAIARQIADALEAAHERGITHRDLKPANIKITPDGVVKVLDFGLAKAASSDGSSPDLTQTPTQTIGGTHEGVILGTAAYMSPEQARGKPVDKRTDIWAFGCVLYEMLTGRAAFAGETLSDTLAAILEREPTWQAVPSTTPDKVWDVLRRCLSKDPHRRLRDIGDARLEMDDAIAGPASLGTLTFAKPKSAAAPQPLWKRAIPVLLAAALASGLTGAALWNAKPSSRPMVTRFSIALTAGQQFDKDRFPSISPDGSHIVYASDDGLYLRSMADPEPKRIAGPETVDSLIGAAPVFSPDSQSIVFMIAAATTDVTLKKISIRGGAPEPLYRGTAVRGIRWDPSGITFGSDGVVRVSENGGTPETLIGLKSHEAIWGPQILPGGDQVLFTRLAPNVSAATGWDAAQIVVQSMKTGERKLLIDGGTDARYLPTGHIVYAHGGTLFAVRFDLRRLEVGGKVPVIEGVRSSGATGASFYSVSRNGTLLYVPAAVSTGSNVTLTWAARNGNRTPLGLPPRTYGFPRVSPDGKRVVYQTDDNNEAIIWIHDLSGGNATRQLTLGGANRYPIWSSDGLRVAFQSDREGDLGIFWQRADGTGMAERLTRPGKGAMHIPDSLSPDGTVLSFTEVKEDSSAIWIHSLSDQKTTLFAGAPSAFFGRSVFSPDGHWLAYQSNETKRYEIYVQPFPANGTRYPISQGPDNSHHPLWSRDGKELFYIPGPNRLLVVSITNKPAFSFGNAEPVPQGGLAEGGPGFVRTYDIGRDGKQFIGITTGGQPKTGTGAAPEIKVVLNWFEELKTHVPVQ